MKSIVKTIDRLVIILAVAGLIVAALSALDLAAGGDTPMQLPGSEANFATGAPGQGHERGEGGASMIGLLELFKNIIVMGLIISAYWFGQTWFSKRKHASRMAA